ncbi:MAG: DUF3225 domain-containing protein [Gammaproteobacteria bacterium]|nr:DUF3225 domain-containing protein [Gammaproteobacteria bacterium]
MKRNTTRISPPLTAAEEEAILAELQTVLTRQQDAWNQGDIDSLLTTYWHSDGVRYASGSQVLRGFEAVRERFHDAYPDRAAMGLLEYTDLEIEIVTGDRAVVFGRWLITRDTGELEGLFTLQFVKFPKGWLMISDHTSSA